MLTNMQFCNGLLWLEIMVLSTRRSEYNTDMDPEFRLKKHVNLPRRWWVNWIFGEDDGDGGNIAIHFQPLKYKPPMNQWAITVWDY